MGMVHCSKHVSVSRSVERKNEIVHLDIPYDNDKVVISTNTVRGHTSVPAFELDHIEVFNCKLIPPVADWLTQSGIPYEESLILGLDRIPYVRVKFKSVFYAMQFKLRWG